MEPLAAEGGYSEWAVSALASSVFAGMWTGSVVGGVLADAVGPGRIMLLCVVLSRVSCRAVARRAVVRCAVVLSRDSLRLTHHARVTTLDSRLTTFDT